MENYSSKGLYYNALHVWLLALLQLAITLTSLMFEDRTDLVLNNDIGFKPEMEGRRRILVLSLFCRALHSIIAVVPT